jgi:hypothetical protein
MTTIISSKKHRPYAEIIKPLTEKRCFSCTEVKGIDSFSAWKFSPDGHNYECKKCHGERNKKYLAQNPSAVEKRRLSSQKFKSTKYERYLVSKAKAQRKRHAERRPTDLLHNAIRSKIHRQLINGKGGKKTFELLGYTPEQLKRNLEKKFLPGMSWDNYGKWHIDHIIPRAAFNITSFNDIDFKRCWALSNLQPLWAMDNYTKRDKIVRPFQRSIPMQIGVCSP